MDYRTWNPTLCDLPTASFSNLISFHSPSCPLHPNHSDLFHEHIKLIYASEPLCLLLHLSGVLSLLCMIQNSGQISTFPRDCLKTNLSKIPPGPIPTPSILCCITLFCFLPPFLKLAEQVLKDPWLLLKLHTGREPGSSGAAKGLLLSPWKLH